MSTKDVIAAGDRVRDRYGRLATVIAVDGDQAWVQRTSGVRGTLDLAELTRIEDGPTEKDGAR